MTNNFDLVILNLQIRGGVQLRFPPFFPLPSSLWDALVLSEV